MYPSQKMLERIVEENYKKLKQGIALETPQKGGPRAKSNRYFKDAKLLFYFSRWLGNFAFTRTKDEAVKLKLISWPVAYTFVRYLMLAIPILFQYRQKMIAVLQADSNVNGILNRLLLMVALHINLIIPVCYAVQLKDMIKYQNTWRQFQADYADRFGSCILFNLSSFVRLSLLLVLCLPVLQTVLLLGILDVRDYSKITFFDVVSFVTASYSMYAFLLTWFFNSYAFQIAIRTLTDHAVQALRTKYSASELRETREMWLQMTALIKNFGSVEMAAFSLVLISIFLVFIISTYGLIICIFDSSFGAAIFVYIFLCLLSFFYMFMLSDCAHKIKDQIGFKFNKKFLEVSMYDFDEEKQIEVEKFLEAMAMENPEINISGYLVVDRTLIVKFIATSVTYLIVLLQFKTSAEEGQREAAEKTSTPRPRPTS